MKVFALLTIRITVLLLLLFLSNINVHSQSVGLVLSGGGAKGCTHIGVIKALEENEIPIDYVAGTSMGAIVGSLYSIGYSAEEMEDLITSNDFRSWLKGDIDEQNRFFFKQEEENPEFFSFKLKVGDTLSIKQILPSSIVSPNQMNQALVYLFGQANSACGGDFDSLFVPFRCVASDVTNKKEVVHRKGDLGDAVRSSMSFPFVFSAVNINNKIMVDGGIYNNFPLDVMKEDLKADYIVGINVGEGPSPVMDGNLVALMENLIMQRNYYHLDTTESTILNFQFKNVNLLDFEKAKELIQIGYDSTIAHIEEIKKNITRRITADSISSKRFAFQQKMPHLLFRNVIIRGVNESQQQYIRKTFHSKDNYFSFNSFKKNYFKLLSDKKIAQIIPHTVYNEETNAFDLILDVTLNDHFRFGVGGNISSTSSNQLYISSRFLAIKRLSYDNCIDGQVGTQYKDVHLNSRIDFPSQLPFCINITGDISHTSYSDSQNAFYETDVSMEGYGTEFYVKSKISIPFLMKGIVSAGIGWGNIKNKYHGLYTRGNKEFDISRNKLGVAILQYKHNSLSDKAFPIDGTFAKVSAQYIFGNREDCQKTPLDSLNFTNVYSNTKCGWLKTSIYIDHFINTSKHFSLGLMAEGVYSTHKLENNYMESLLMSPTFTPTTHSKMVFNNAFSANTYIAAGIKPIIKVTKLLQIRSENYAFLPHKAIEKTITFGAKYHDALSKIYFLAEMTLVAQLKFFTASAYVNWYSYPKKNFNFGLNIGYLIFHDKLIE